MDTLLRTGAAARMLGVSRQHLVDLCDRGDVSFVRVGSHRRIPNSEVSRLLMRSTLTREREKSLWLHRAALAYLFTDPSQVLDRVRANIARIRAAHRPDGMTVAYLDRWTSIVDRGVDAIAETMTSSTEQACELRQNTPFAGVLPAEVRLAVLSSFADHWQHEHADAGGAR